MYKFRAIILNITKIRDNNTRFVMISIEYWKITGWWNKKNITGIDLWDIVEVLVDRQGSKNTIKNIDIITSWWNKDWDYTSILLFLETLSIINKITIDWTDCRLLYEDTATFIDYWHRWNMKLYHYAIFQMRILKALGSMDPNMVGDDIILNYIYQNISHTPLERILASSNIKNEAISKIQKINLHSIYMLDR